MKRQHPAQASALYVGTVDHRRLAPFRHQLRYRVFQLLVDLDELPALDRKTTLFSHNRWNLFSFHDADHGPRDGTPLRPWIERHVAAAGIDLGEGSIRVLSFPRILGYVFDPLTVWFCHDQAGTLRAVLYEIHNTFGEAHSHLVEIPPDASPGMARHRFEKVFHVSPFFDVGGSYEVRLRPPEDRFNLGIVYEKDGQRLMTAATSAERRELSSRNLARVFATHPLLTLKVIGGIHWEAVKLWLKGARYRRRPAAPETAVSVSRRLERTA